MKSWLKWPYGIFINTIAENEILPVNILGRFVGFGRFVDLQYWECLMTYRCLKNQLF